MLDGVWLVELAALSEAFLVAQEVATASACCEGASRTALPRQQTLEATLDWSYRLLTQMACSACRRAVNSPDGAAVT